MHWHFFLTNLTDEGDMEPGLRSYRHGKHSRHADLASKGERQFRF